LSDPSQKNFSIFATRQLFGLFFESLCFLRQPVVKGCFVIDAPSLHGAYSPQQSPKIKILEVRDLGCTIPGQSYEKLESELHPVRLTPA